MPQPFLKQVAEFLKQKYDNNLHRVCIVLPSRRGAVFLKRHIGAVYGKTTWLPLILSSEQFIEKLSGLKVIDEHELVCRLFDSYLQVYGEGAENFDSFLKWGQLILQDFNEIDRYLVDAKSIYENLKDIKEIENWSLSADPLTPYQTEYLKFMGSLGKIYTHFTTQLLADHVAYQGLAYREASKGVVTDKFTSHPHILLCGFNALNEAEKKIFLSFQQANRADILWDADRYYIEQSTHEAGMFLREHFETFGTRDTMIGDHFSSSKKIDIVSVPRQMGQAQVMREQLLKLKAEGVAMSDVAVVLANEHLLAPVLMQLPEEIGPVNITMEYPLKYSDVYGFMQALIDIHHGYTKQNKSRKNIYYKDLLNIIRLPITNDLLRLNASEISAQGMVDLLVRGNFIFPDQNALQKLFPTLAWFTDLLNPLLSPHQLCQAIATLLDALADWYANNQKGRSQLERECTRILLTHFNQLHLLMNRYPAAAGMYTLRQMFQHMVGSATVPFLGEPLQGLQIMGVLETRTLDFPYLIILNVNEGVLPSGRSPHSFLPNDLRNNFKLPLYVQKDAIYAYHFYRLIQRAQEILITCDSETDSFGKGEQSRFVTQLKLELPAWNPTIQIESLTAITSSAANSKKCELKIKRHPKLLEPLIQRLSGHAAFQGLSVSAINTYQTCSLKYYLQYIAKIREADDIEETPDASTLGTIMHRVLEKLYSPYCSQSIAIPHLQAMLKQAPNEISLAFEELTHQKVLQGKAILQAEVALKYVERTIQNDIKLIKSLSPNQSLFIHALENRYVAPINIPYQQGHLTLYITGIIDRVDEVNGMYRIIDYKSSIRKDDKFDLSDLSKLFTNVDYHKLLQLMVYAWLLHKNNVCKPEAMDLNIFGFKNPSNISGKPLLNKVPAIITTQLLDEFEVYLTQTVTEMLKPEGEFIGTDDLDNCKYCGYTKTCFRQPRTDGF